MTVDVHLTYTWTSTSFISYILNSYRQTSALKFLQPKHGNANKNRGRHTATIAHLAVSALGTEKITSTMQKAPLRPWLCGWSFANVCKLTCMTELTLKRQRAGDNEVVPANEKELNVSRPLNSQVYMTWLILLTLNPAIIAALAKLFFGRNDYGHKRSSMGLRMIDGIPPAAVA